MKQFAVVGLGRFGYSVAVTLARYGHEVLAVDSDDTKVQAVAEHVTHAVQADATSEDTMRALGIKNFDTVIVGIGQNIQANILATVIIKEMGVRWVVSKAQNELHGKVLAKTGADQVVYPEQDMGVRLATNLVSNNILEYIALSPDYGIVELSAAQKFWHRSLGDLDFRARYELNVIALRRSEEMLIAPGAQTMIKPMDILVIVGSTQNINSFDQLNQ